MAIADDRGRRPARAPRGTTSRPSVLARLEAVLALPAPVGDRARRRSSTWPVPRHVVLVVQLGRVPLAEGPDGLLCGLPSTTTSPWSSMITRSQSWRTASRPWVTKHDRAPLALELPDALHALALERLVAHGEHLVDEEDLGVDVDGDRERQPHVHARRVELDLVVDELLDAGEVDDVVEVRVGLLAGTGPGSLALR